MRLWMRAQREADRRLGRREADHGRVHHVNATMKSAKQVWRGDRNCKRCILSFHLGDAYDRRQNSFSVRSNQWSTSHPRFALALRTSAGQAASASRPGAVARKSPRARAARAATSTSSSARAECRRRRRAVRRSVQRPASEKTRVRRRCPTQDETHMGSPHKHQNRTEQRGCTCCVRALCGWISQRRQQSDSTKSKRASARGLAGTVGRRICVPENASAILSGEVCIHRPLRLVPPSHRPTSSSP